MKKKFLKKKRMVKQLKNQSKIMLKYEKGRFDVVYLPLLKEHLDFVFASLNR